MPTTSTITSDPTLEAHLFWYRFRREILGAIILALLLIVGFAGYWLYSQRQEAAASRMLGGAKTAPEYQQVIARYPNSAAGASAYLLLAESQRRDGKYAESNATLQTFLTKHATHEFVSTAQVAIAINLESLGKLDEALALYRQISVKYPHSFNAPLALASAVRLLKSKNQLDEARRTCEMIINQYPTSYWASDAARELSTLKPPGEPPPQATPANIPAASEPLPVRPPMALPSASAPPAAPTAKPPP